MRASAAQAELAPQTAAFPDIGDYAAIGDCRCCALVSRDGSVDWLCLPDYSSPSLFGALLDRDAGHFRVAPRDVKQLRRAYIGDSNVLRTRFECCGGVVELTDALVLPERARGLQPQGELLRRIACVEGEVDIAVEFAPRPRYARATPRFVRRGSLGWQCTHCGFGAWLRSDVELSVDDRLHALRSRMRLRAGETRWLSFAYDEFDACPLPLLGDDAAARLQRTIDWWQRWAGKCRYQGEYAPALRRSLLTVKMLTSCLSGAIIAAATTSLPEHRDAQRNWDYRYCWVRDSAFALPQFLALGYLEEAGGFLGWLLHNTRLSWPQLQVMYDLYGRDDLPERTLDHLSGYRGAGPVRVGNAACDQLQLDIYGELLTAVQAFVDAGGTLDRDECRMLRGLGTSLLRRWRDPDQGIWETRGPPQHNTYSKIMCWKALRCLASVGRKFDVGIAADSLEHTAEAVRQDVDEHAFDPQTGAYAGRYGGGDDASLLLLPDSGFLERDDPRLRATYDRLQQALSRGDLWWRYAGERDGVGGPDNAFAPCSFWAVAYLAALGRRDEARALFERTLRRSNDVGLFAEEFDESGGLWGNFPQALTQVSLIRAALAIDGEAS